MQDVGYSVYDLYDLGEFDQKGTVPTKYGTKDEYPLAAIKALRSAGINVYGDIVSNQMMGADGWEDAKPLRMPEMTVKQQISGEENIGSLDKVYISRKKGRYSDFVWELRYRRGLGSEKKKAPSYSFDRKSMEPERRGFRKRPFISNLMECGC